jgi:hypothetical protein
VMGMAGRWMIRFAGGRNDNSRLRPTAAGALQD